LQVIIKVRCIVCKGKAFEVKRVKEMSCDIWNRVFQNSGIARFSGARGEYSQ
jgi:hypothetical protein